MPSRRPRAKNCSRSAPRRSRTHARKPRAKSARRRRAWRRNLRLLLRKKAKAISWAITNATSARAAVDAQQREAETRLANLKKEVAELRVFAQKESVWEVERVRAATQTDAQKIATAAKAEIE